VVAIGFALNATTTSLQRMLVAAIVEQPNPMIPLSAARLTQQHF
jgi:hypothetical protein